MINLEFAKQLIDRAEKEAQNINVPMVICIVDESGNLIACHRMDDALLVSVELAQNKAWTSIALKLPTAELAEEVVPGSSIYGLNTTHNGRIVVFGGGIPLYKNGKIIGAIGVSGGSVEEDIQVAQAAVDHFLNVSQEEV